jgi:hypothetical protein
MDVTERTGRKVERKKRRQEWKGGGKEDDGKEMSEGR